jgi:phosphoribosylformylglycinamidine synthase
VLEKINISDGPLAPDLQRALSVYEAARQEIYGTGSDAAAHPPSLMDMAVIGAKVLKKRGLVTDIDESPEVNACTVKITADFRDGSSEPWLLMFKNETHNHPTEIEPFGGAATCLGGAIRDPLSGRACVYQSMRVTGGADPRVPLAETLPGKLPQIKIARDAAAGFTSYGNQIGLTTGQVAEFYHPGFLAKRMELGALIGAAPVTSVRREEPAPGDLVIMVGGKTGRDGIGGATGSSKIQSGESVESAGAEVQKGNAVEERKLLRLFRNPDVSRLIKRCNDFGAGGVSVAVGELAAGLDINLDKVPVKYAGLNGIELAISESQERMAVVIAAENSETFIALAGDENLEAVIVAEVTAEPRLKMTWNGIIIVDLSREFLNSGGALKHARVKITAPEVIYSGADNWKELVTDLNICSQRGLAGRFDASAGAGSVLMPFGGKTQQTPAQAMAARIARSDTASVMAWGFNPVISQQSPYHGAALAVVESIAKIVAAGGKSAGVRLSFQEYFERLRDCPERWVICDYHSKNQQYYFPRV